MHSIRNTRRSKGNMFQIGDRGRGHTVATATPASSAQNKPVSQAENQAENRRDLARKQAISVDPELSSRVLPTNKKLHSL